MRVQNVTFSQTYSTQCIKQLLLGVINAIKLLKRDKIDLNFMDDNRVERSTHCDYPTENKTFSTQIL